MRNWVMHCRFALLLACAFGTGVAARAATPADANITMYHGDPARSGNFVSPGLSFQVAKTLHRDRGFAGAVDGAVYAQPLYWHPKGATHGMLIVVTEQNEVAALDAITGRTIWHVTLGSPVPHSILDCGNINPLGITGTPVIESQHGALYLDAMVDRNGTPQQLVFGLNLASGAVLPGWPVDIQHSLRARGFGFKPQMQNQRAALALLDHRVFVAYGGNDGDCGPYHGVIAGLAIDKPGVVAAWRTRGTKGGIWAPGGISVAGGSLFFTTGNTETGPDWADGEGVFRLKPNLAATADPDDFYAPANWKTLDEEDLDMSGVGPLPIDLPGGVHRLLALGKDGEAYLLNRDDLGGIGGQIADRPAAKSAIVGAMATFPAQSRAIVAFQARRALCPDGGFSGGLAAIAITANTITPMWCAPLDGRGVPIVTTTDSRSDPIVWVDGAQGDDRLHAYNGDTGAPLYTSAHPIPGVQHFQTILVADHRLYIAGDGRVTAFTWNPP
ncbi:MAG: hypothetical protein PHT60_07660 [Acidiphilium sp.]|nr:hypothetical protein [Acidiphilium sp.]MDD4935639.1 hypothetical protein [Acidiphilium sp.]